jgi:hypothetical protein
MKALRLALALFFVLGVLGTAFAATSVVTGPSSPALERPNWDIIPIVPPTPPPPPPPPKK